MSQLDRLREAQWAVRRAATERWKERSFEREKGLRDIEASGDGAADSPMRVARFKARAATFQQARELRSQGRLSFGIERKMGPTLDWTPYAPSDGARKAGRPVARVVLLGGPGTQPQGFATSFLVTSRLLLTNHHVFPTKADASGTGANFLFERSDRGIEAGVTFEIDADSFYLSDEQLDFAIVGVKPRSAEGQSIGDFGSVQLVEATSKILIGHRINIIQHPEGGPKQYAITENRLVDLLDSGFLHYDTDTLEGSSGSPAYSEDWQLVGLHHASIPEMIGDRVVAVGGGFWDESMPDDKVHWIANEGVRVSALVKHLGGVKMDDPKKQDC
jgi:endonuclease G